MSEAEAIMLLILVFVSGGAIGALIGMKLAERIWRPHANNLAKIWKDHAEWVTQHYKARLEAAERRR